MKFHPATDSQSRQPVSYNRVKEHVINYIQREYDRGADIARSLEDLQLFDLNKVKPKRDQSTKIDATTGQLTADGKFEQETFDREFDEDNKIFRKRKDLLSSNLEKAYAYIFGQCCTSQMKSALERLENFENTIKNDPIELLKAIKTLMYDSSTTRYPFMSLTDSIRDLINLKQYPPRPDGSGGESVTNYMKRFKTVRDVMTKHTGTDFLEFFVKQSKRYKDETDATKKQEMIDGAFEKWMAYLLLENSDQAKYGSLLRNLRSQYSMEHDQYPDNFERAVTMLSEHPIDNAKKLREQRQQARQKNDDEDGDRPRAQSHAQKKGEKICFACGKPGHVSTECQWAKDNPDRSKWFFNTMNKNLQQHLEDENDQDDDDNANDDISVLSTNSGRSGVSNATTRTTGNRSTRSSRRGWSGFQREIMNSCALTDSELDVPVVSGGSNAQGEEDVSLALDSGSSFHLVKDKEIMENVSPVKNPMIMGTNAGTKKIRLQGELPDVGRAWVDEDAMTSVLSLGLLSDKYHVTYDNKKEDAFIVDMGHKKVKFPRGRDNMYRFFVPKDIVEENRKAKKEQTNEDGEHGECHSIATVRENRQFYTKRQFERAKEARALYHKVGAPRMENLKAMIRANMIANCPVTVEDINIAQEIFGDDVSTLKGKSTRRKPKPVQDDLIEVPKEIMKKHHRLTLSIDAMHVNKIPMLTTIDHTIKYRGLVPMKNTTADEFYASLDMVVRKYNDAGFTVARIHCDGAFKSLMRAVADDMDIELNPTSKDEHVPAAERNIRVIKERVRTHFHRLPFKAIPKVMIEYLCMVSTAQLNYFPVKGGVSEHFSPRTIMQQRPLDFNKHLQVPFGAYVQAYYEPKRKSSLTSRTRDAIYLRPTNTVQGGHEVLDLHTKRVLTCGRVKVVPMTDLVIKTVEEWGKAQGFKTLKFTNRFGNVYQDADLIAGVDYEDENDENNNNNENNNEIEEDEEENEFYDELQKYAANNNADGGEENDADDDENVERDQVDEEELAGVLRDNNEQSNQVGENEENEENNNDDENVDNNNDNENVENNDDEMEIVFETDDESENEENEDGNDEPNQDSDEDGSDNEDAGEEGPTHGGANYPIPGRTTRSGRTYVQSVENNDVPMRRNKKVTFEDDLKRSMMNMQRELEFEHNLASQVSPNPDMDIGYEEHESIVIARIIETLKLQFMMKKGTSNGQQYLLQKGLKKFGKAGHEAAFSELDQLHQRVVFEPIDVKKLTAQERRRAQEALMFLTQKRCGKIKGRMVFNGKPTRAWLSREESASPTVSLESLFLTATIDAHEGRDIMTADVPNAFVQTEMDIKEGEEKVIMKITGVLVDMLIQINTEYGKHVVYENGRKVMYVQLLRALYGMLQSSLLWYRKFRKELEEEGFVFNNYDPCVANRTKRGKQHTIRFHVDDVMSSHVDKRVNDDFEKWLQKKYGGFKPVVAVRGPKHDYLGMLFDFSEKGKVRIGMQKYVQEMIEEFPTKIKSTDLSQTPANEQLFDIGNGKRLTKEKSEDFHTAVAKGLFLSKRARPDVQPTIAFLCTRVQEPTETDWSKLVRMMKYLNATKKKVLTLSADKLSIVKWYVDASFAVHPDYKSHTGATMTWGNGAVQSMSRKQKLNTRSSTEAELVAVDDAAVMILWTKLFLEDQGYEIEKNILYQDNRSAILLETNGRKSAGKRSRALNIRYFFMTDQIEKGNVSVEYCPTDELTSDFMTKPLQGVKFVKFRDDILGR